MNFVTISPLISGIAWTVAFIGMVGRGFKDKTFGMSLIPLAMDLCYDFLRSFVYRGSTPNQITSIIWFILDALIAFTFLRFGYRKYRETFGVSRNTFIAVTVLTFAGAMAILVTAMPFFAKFGGYFQHSIDESAIFVAFVQNLVISVSYLALLWLRRSSAGQSMTVAVAKLIGTGLTAELGSLIAHSDDNWALPGIIAGLTVILDLWYCVLLFRQLRSEGHRLFQARPALDTVPGRQLQMQ